MASSAAPETDTEDPVDSFPGMYTVRTRFHHHGDETIDLTFGEAMRMIKDRFEQSHGAVFFASIERQP